ncbi:MAG: hypothetical protein SPE10_03385 [Paludibacteraceae bacterium]|nr:hypothetical protein [Paludibacteraceae bacterium]
MTHTHLPTILAAAVIAISLIFSSCNCQKSASGTANQTKSVIGALPTHITFSNSFRAFWDDFARDTRHVRNLDKYKPSDDFAATAPVALLDGAYVVSGYLTIDDTFDADAFKALGGEYNRIDATTATFKMPLKRLPEMWQIRGIVSVEAATRVHLRKR